VKPPNDRRTAIGATGNERRRRNRTGACHQRNGKWERSEVVGMVLMDGLFRLLAFALAAPAQHHVESHGEEEQAASNVERGHQVAPAANRR